MQFRCPRTLAGPYSRVSRCTCILSSVPYHPADSIPKVLSRISARVSCSSHVHLCLLTWESDPVAAAQLSGAPEDQYTCLHVTSKPSRVFATFWGLRLAEI